MIGHWTKEDATILRKRHMAHVAGLAKERAFIRHRHKNGYHADWNYKPNRNWRMFCYPGYLAKCQIGVIQND